jgi:hypothetical protein
MDMPIQDMTARHEGGAIPRQDIVLLGRPRAPCILVVRFYDCGQDACGASTLHRLHIPMAVWLSHMDFYRGIRPWRISFLTYLS